MKALAAANIGDYEKAVTALGDYYLTVEQGLGVCFRDPTLQPTTHGLFNKSSPPCIIIFGSDQGLVGQFNDSIADFTLNFLKSPLFQNAEQALFWTVGERLNEVLLDVGLKIQANFSVPNSVKSITPLIGEILLSIETHQPFTALSELHLFYNSPANSPAYHAVNLRLLPLDLQWCKQLAEKTWPSNNMAELLGNKTKTLGALIREYIFVSLFRASAESLSSENASRLAAMQRADQNIEELLATLKQNYHRKRQAGIDEEMFDVIAGANF